MRLTELVKKTINALGIENELHLAFIFGYRIDSNKYRERKMLQSRGALVKSLVFLNQVFSRVSVRSRDQSPATYVLYAGTNNQCRALSSTAEGMAARNLPFCFLYDRHVTCVEPEKGERWERVYFTVKESVAALIVMFRLARKLLHNIHAENGELSREKYFDKFAQAYIYIPYFFEVLSSRRPDYVVMANDHNPQNRCLRLVAERLGIKTVFMQHGSGNVLLPALDFDYAFLDGYESVEKYARCAESATLKGERVVQNRTTIFLSGAKHEFPAYSNKLDGLTIGLALNPHDQREEFIDVMTSLLRKGLDCLVRAHPMQDQDDLRVLGEMEAVYPNLRISIFEKESVHSFLSRCSLLIAGDSSIHLEAAIAGVPTYYYRFGVSGLPLDHLHHVRGGIAKPFPKNYDNLSADDFLSLSLQSDDTREAIRRFSESFGTEWQGREGELVIETLVGLESGNAFIRNVYTSIEEKPCFKAIYRLEPGRRHSAT